MSRIRFLSIPKPFRSSTQSKTCWPARVCLLILLVTALGGGWTLEQPNGSTLEFFPTFRSVMSNIFAVGGPNAVTRQFFWWSDPMSNEENQTQLVFLLLIFVKLKNLDLNSPKSIFSKSHSTHPSGFESLLVDATLCSAYTQTALWLQQFSSSHAIGQR